jgi:trimethylamine--corrinoid protein Co-methyltransferase
MFTGRLWELHEDADLGKIDAAAVRLLTQTGCRIEHEGLLSLLEGAGCRVDLPALRAYLPEELIRRALAHLGGEADSRDVSGPTGWNPQAHTGQSGSYPHLLDWPSGHRRLPSRQDAVDMARLGHMLPECDFVGKVLTCHDLDQRIEPLWYVLTLAQTTNKPISGGEIFYPDYIEPLVQMGSVLSGREKNDWFISACDFFISPLVFDRRQAGVFLEKRRLGLPNLPGTMVISGMSAPVTLAAACAVGLAELIAGFVFGYVVNPDLPASGLIATGSLDMRSATAVFGSPEALLQDVTLVQACERLYQIPARCAWGYVDCKKPGIDATFQKLMPLCASPFGSGSLVGNEGLLSAGQDYCPVQHLLDVDMNMAIQRFYSGFEVNEDTLAVELLEELAPLRHTNFLDTEHTRNHYRAEQWYPRWLDRTLWQGEEIERAGEHQMLERISQYVQDTIASYEPPDLDQEKLAELKKIFLAAEKKILGANVTKI